MLIPLMSMVITQTSRDPSPHLSENTNHPGGAIERWEDETFRTCFSDILNGNWKRHDPYELEGRINARNSIYGRPNQVRSLYDSLYIVFAKDEYLQASVFRTFQGWLAMRSVSKVYTALRSFNVPYLSETAPHEGTLKVFPDVVASNAYMILRPFFRPIASPVSQDALDPKNWEYGN